MSQSFKLTSLISQGRLLRRTAPLYLKLFFMKLVRGNGTIGKFRIPRYSLDEPLFCAKPRLMRVTSQREDKQTYENCVWVGEKKENLKR